MKLSNARPLIERFKRLKALVVGDLMLDHFIWGAVSRISPEAPVPVVEVMRDSEVPGGAGNVAVNLAALGAEVYLAGLVGDDVYASRLLAMFPSGRVHTAAVVRTSDRPTIVKTRIIAHHQQIVRFDRERKAALPHELLEQLWRGIERVLPEIDCVILSDYAKGVIASGLLSRLLPALRRRGIPVTVDPKLENFKLYRQITCMTPNVHEAMDGGGVRTIGSEEEFNALGEKILKRLNAQSILITRGEKGMSLFERGKKPYYIPTRAREVFDVTGAGDTVISTFTLAVAAGAPMRIAAELSNYAAGVVVAKIGTATATGAEILKAVQANHG
jgi:D-glycero-beta-D-manno-heptose-7-phosphate kinase